MIGIALHARMPADHLDAVDAGQAEVQDHDVGEAAGRQVERGLAVGRRFDLVPTGTQVGAQAPQDLRLVVDHQDPGHGASAKRHHHREAAARRVLDREFASHRLDEALGDGQSESDPVGR